MEKQLDEKKCEKERERERIFFCPLLNTHLPAYNTNPSNIQINVGQSKMTVQNIRFKT